MLLTQLLFLRNQYFHCIFIPQGNYCTAYQVSGHGAVFSFQYTGYRLAGDKAQVIEAKGNAVITGKESHLGFLTGFYLI